MTRPWSCQCVFLLGGCLLALAACTSLLPSSPVSRTSAAVGDAAQTCFVDVFGAAMPGKTNYCLGMRDWQAGHYTEGIRRLTVAAGWGNKNAQYTLGLIYYNGHHVAMNRPLGLAWLKLANERDNDPQIARVTRAAFKLAPPAERRQAQQLFDRMDATYGDKVAAARAWRRLQRWQARHGRSATGCVPLQGAEAIVARKQGLATYAPMSPVPGGAQVHVSTGLATVHQPIIGDPLWLRLHRSPTTQQTQDMHAVQQQHARISQSLDAVCMPVAVQRQLVQQSADQYFQGLIGSVDVGPLQSVPAPAASSRT